MEAYCILIMNNATGWKKLQNSWQEITCNSRSLDKMKIISIRHYREIWSLNRIDHENLKYFWEPYKLNGQQARWYLKLQDYDFILQHIPGKTNIKADVLSRNN